MSMITKSMAKKAKPAKRVIKDSPLPSVLGKDRIREAVWAVSREDSIEAIGTAEKTSIPSTNGISYRKTRKNGKVGRFKNSTPKA